MCPHLKGEPAGGNKTGTPVYSGYTSLMPPYTVQWGTHFWAYKTHEMREVALSDSIQYLSCILDLNSLHLYTQ